MPLDDSIALISEEAVGHFLDIPLSDDPRAAEVIVALINAASQEIMNLCTGRKFRKVTTAIDEIFKGDGTAEYSTKNAPITGTPTLYYWDGNSWVELDSSYSTSTDDTDGKIWFDDGNVFFGSTRPNNWKVSYTYGWDLKDVPADLQLACLRMIALNKKLFDNSLHGVNSESFGDQSISYTFDKMPSEVMAIIRKYKRRF